MRRAGIPLVVLGVLLLSFAAAQVQRVMDAPTSVDRWLVADGQVMAVQADGELLLNIRYGWERSVKNPDLSHASLSPDGSYVVASMHEPLAVDARQSKLQSEYLVLDRDGEIVQRAQIEVNSDEKRYQAAVSNEGILAIVDPLYLYLRFYEDGGVIHQSQLYKLDGNLSLERKVRLWWDQGVLSVIVERPALNGGTPLRALFMRINRAGIQLKTMELPFAYILDVVSNKSTLFFSGYDYDPVQQAMRPLIVAMNKGGQIKWTHQHFGHELALSSNGRYLGALRGAAEIAVFDLEDERWQRYSHGLTGDILKGIAVLDDGNPIAFSLDKRFFARRQPASVVVYHGGEGEIAQLDMDPTFPQLLKFYTRGNRAYTGTRYEWLEIKF